MAEIIPFQDLMKVAERCEVLALFKRQRPPKVSAWNPETFEFPTARPGISGNLSDLFEQANAVAARHYKGDPKVPAIVADQCVELIKVLSRYAQPE